MLAKSFCGCLSLVAGTVIIAFCFIELALLILVSILPNFVSFQAGVLFAVVFAVVMFIAGVLLILAAHKESKGMSLVGLVLIVVLIVLFVLGSACSFLNDKSVIKYVCVEDRCPETFWAAPLNFRANSSEDHYITTTEHNNNVTIHHPTMDLLTDVTIETERTTPTNWRRRRQDAATVAGDTTEEDLGMTTLGQDDPYDQITEEPQESQGGGSSGYVMGVALLAAVVMFFINLGFLVFSAVTVFSYSQEIKVAKRFSQQMELSASASSLNTRSVK